MDLKKLFLHAFLLFPLIFSLFGHIPAENSRMTTTEQEGRLNLNYDVILPDTYYSAFYSEVEKLSAFDGIDANGNEFGSSVSVSEDIVAVGAPGDKGYRGAVYLYARNNDEINQLGLIKKITPADVAYDDRFGTKVILEGDTLIVVSPYANSYAGAIYIFDKNSGGQNEWGLIKKFSFSGRRNGLTVAYQQDLLIIGMVNAYDASSSSPGIINIYTRNSGGVNNWGLIKTLTSPEQITSPWFGWQIALDNNILVVTGPKYYYSDFITTPVVYIFYRNKGGQDAWGEAARLSPPDLELFSCFGLTLALNGETLVAGSECENNNSGVVYIFSKNQNGADAWGQVKKLTSKSPNDNDVFGIGMSLFHDKLVIGAWGEMVKGVVYYFERNKGGLNNWGLVKEIIPQNLPDFAQFGRSISLNEQTLAVGAQGDANSPGSLYLFNRVGNEWLQMDFQLPTINTNGQFGSSSSFSDNFLVAGSPGTTINSKQTGAAFIYTSNPEGELEWQFLKRIEPPDGESGDAFGSSVAMDGDWVAVGSPNHEAKGSVYLYKRNESGADSWGFIRKINAPDGAIGDRFGESITISKETLVIGAKGASVDGQVSRGAVYLYELNQGGAEAWGYQKKFVHNSGLEFDRFGYSLAFSNDTIAVGCEGVALVSIFSRHQGGPNNWGLSATILDPDPVSGSGFGLSLAAYDEQLAIGNPKQGAVYIFRRDLQQLGEWGQIAKLVVNEDGSNLRIGNHIAFHGDTLSTSLNENDSENPLGIVYLFGRNFGGKDTWGLSKKLSLPEEPNVDYPINTLSLFDGLLAVGTSNANSNSGDLKIYQYIQVHPLEIAFEGPRPGTISVSPIPVSCVSNCTSLIEEGTSITLTAEPSNNSVFVGWKGDCSGTGACTLTMDQRKNVTATFKFSKYRLDVIHQGTGSGFVYSVPTGINCRIDCTELYNYGANVELNALPDEGSYFVGWSGDCAGSDTCEIVMDQSRNVSAIFGLFPRYRLDVIHQGTGSGLVHSEPPGINCGIDCTELYALGTEVILTATPDQGSYFFGWSGACTGTNECITTIYSDEQAIAIFKKIPLAVLDVILSVEGPHQRIDQIISGDIIKYYITLENNGDASANEIIINDPLPSVLLFDKWCEQGGAIKFGNTIQWNGDLPPNSQKTICFSALVNAGNSYIGKEIKNTVYLYWKDVGERLFEITFRMDGKSIFLPVIIRQ